MKSQHRKFIECLLCGTPGENTREHIFTKALSDRLNLDTEVNIPRVRFPQSIRRLSKEEIKKQWKKGGGKVMDLTSHCFCAECNESFSGEIRLIVDELKDLILGKTRSIKKESQNFILRYFERIALIMDAETAKHDSEKTIDNPSDQDFDKKSRKHGPVLRKDELILFKNGERLPRCRVQLAHHGGILGHNIPIYISSHYSPQQNKRITIVIKNLAISIQIGDKPRPLNGIFKFIEKTGATESKLPEVSEIDILKILNPDPEIIVMLYNFKNIYHSHRMRSEFKTEGDYEFHFPLELARKFSSK